MKTIANILSILLHPIFMPTYGMVWYVAFMQQFDHQTPIISWVLLILATVLFTLIMPISCILLLKKRGYISSINLDKAEERMWPYIYTAISYLFWTYFLYRHTQLPIPVCQIALGATLSEIAVMLINFGWKISAHATGIGGLIGGLIGIQYLLGAELNFAAIIPLMLVALVLMYARLYLDKHTSLQVVTGFLLGIIATCVPCIF